MASASSPVRFIAKPATVATPVTVAGAMGALEARADEHSPILPLAAIALIAFAVLGSTPSTTSAPASQSDDEETRTPSRASVPTDFSSTMAPALIIGGIVALAKTGRMPGNILRGVERMLDYDLVVLFLTVSYAHYIVNVENSHLDTDTRYYDAMLRVGAFVTAWWLARKMLVVRK